MGFEHVSLGTFLGGLALLAGVLWLLQRLRVRHQEKTVPTLLFWREAVQETRARVLVRRFRHPLAYLLALAILALLWTAMADPRDTSTPNERVVCLLDGSALMGYGDRFAEAAELLSATVDRFDPMRREVLLCGARVQPLLEPGEATVLLDRRLEGQRPQACPPTVEGVLRSLVAANSDRTQLRVVIFGDGPVSQACLDELPRGVRVQRAKLSPPSRPANRGITALGVAEARSAAWDRVDALYTVEGPAAAQAVVEARLDGMALPGAAEPGPATEESARFFLRDLPARGGRLRLRILHPVSGADGLDLDDVAAIDLPDRPRLRVAFDPVLPETLREVLAVDPAVELCGPDETVDLALRWKGSMAGRDSPDVPSLVFVPAARQTDAFLLRMQDDGEVLTDHHLHALAAELDLDQIDATALADVARRPVSVGIERGPVRQVSVWAELLGEEYDWISSRAFPLFVSHALRWLAGDVDVEAWRAAGEVARGGFVLRAGVDQAGATVAALTDPVLTRPAAFPGAELAVARLPTVGAGWEDVTLLLLLAFALLITDWILFGRGRMP